MSTSTRTSLAAVTAVSAAARQESQAAGLILVTASVALFALAISGLATVAVLVALEAAGV